MLPRLSVKKPLTSLGSALLLCTSFLTGTTFAKPAISWSKNIGALSAPTALPDGSTLLLIKGNLIQNLDPRGQKNWEVPITDIARAPGVRSLDGMLYFGAYNDHIQAILPDGRLKWRYNLDGDLFATPLLRADGSLVAASVKGQIVAIKDGQKLWEYRAGGGVYSSPAQGLDGTIYFGSQDGKLYALSPEGKLRWSFQAGSTLFSSPAIDEDGTIYIGSSDRSIYAINPDGSLKWKYTTKLFVNASPIITRNGLIVVGSFDSDLYAINRDGTLAWQTDLKKAIAAPAIETSNGEIIVGNYAGVLSGLNEKGEILWQLELDSKIDTPLSITENGYGYVITSKGTLYQLVGLGSQSLGHWSSYRGVSGGWGRALKTEEWDVLKRIASNTPQPVTSTVTPSQTGNMGKPTPTTSKPNTPTANKPSTPTNKPTTDVPVLSTPSGKVQQPVKKLALHLVLAAMDTHPASRLEALLRFEQALVPGLKIGWDSQNQQFRLKILDRIYPLIK
ncbi:outer membrane protein assembly factor BamB family protein [Deinococcus cellulosilyticus]|uniref:outer membrane protein assembly factor BamB family protein n=1 Tax=Deinococcus cellulosilyticus TaxID=401558 RepID=UPI0016499699|nr:PQQ-binding-like beta-propeller repeat protein [Deinococcus cellulosilyticus]